MERRKKNTSAGQPRAADTVPAPHHYLISNEENPEKRQDALITALLLAGEALASPYRDPLPEPPEYAKAVNPILPLQDDFDELQGLLEQIRAWAADARRAELLEQVRKSFNDGTMLRVLFQRLFPDQPAPPVRDADNRLILSKREVDVLREAAGDHAYEEIAARLRVSHHTVNRHFENIYRKLGVHRPMQAVTRAVSLGYLDIDATDQFTRAATSWPRNYTAFETLMGENYGTLAEPEGPFRTAAEFGLLLLVLSHRALKVQRKDRTASSPALHSVLCKIDMQGKVLCSFGADLLQRVMNIVIVPAHAARQGFTPGNLLVLKYEIRFQGTNDTCLLEFTPTGDFVRRWAGSQSVATHLQAGQALAFASDGRLLVSEANSIVAFHDNGRSVARFADFCSTGLAVSRQGTVYAVHHSSIGCLVRALDSSGKQIATLGGTPAGVSYSGLAVSLQGSVFVSRFSHRKDAGDIEVYDPNGRMRCEFEVSGLRSSPTAFARAIFCDKQDRLYVVCSGTGDINVYTPDGALLDSINLRGVVAPQAATFDENETMWVCGVPPD